MDTRAVLLVLAFVCFKAAKAEPLFRIHDLNKDGKVHPVEVKMSWMSWSNNMVYWSQDANFLAFDRDEDGELNEAEFRSYEKDGVSQYFFTLSDTDADGKITASEMRTFFQLSGWPEEVIDRLVLNDFDEEDGKLDFEEFNKWFASLGKNKDFVLEDFKAHDKDGDGAVSYDEYYRMMVSIRAYDYVSMVGISVFTMDLNKDGKLDFEEFVAGFYPEQG